MSRSKLSLPSDKYTEKEIVGEGRQIVFGSPRKASIVDANHSINITILLLSGHVSQ